MKVKYKRNESFGGDSNKARYTATLVACGWAGAVLEKVTRASGQEPYAQKEKSGQPVSPSVRRSRLAFLALTGGFGVTAPA